MKKKILISLISATFITCNFFLLSPQHESNSIFTLSDANASDLSEWWNRNDYTCDEMDCTCNITVGGLGEVRDGKYENCEDVGDGQGDVAHCWNCDMGCDCF